MGRFKYSFNTTFFAGENLSKSADRLVRFGYDAIELVGDPESYPDTKTIRSTLGQAGLAVSSIGSIYDAHRDLCHPEPSVREHATAYACRMADFAAEVGAPVVLVAPSAWAKLEPLAAPDAEWAWAVENVRRVGEHAAEMGVAITLEPGNRFETYFLNRLDQAVDLLKATGLTNVGVNGDTFHMNIEETFSIADAYRQAGSYLNHTHIADSNRGAPGTGHIDFRPILRALDDIEYQGYLCFELVPPKPDFGPGPRSGKYPEFLDPQTENAIAHMTSIEAELWPSV